VGAVADGVTGAGTAAAAAATAGVAAGNRALLPSQQSSSLSLSTVGGGDSEPVLKAATLLRQWLELRPEVPPTQLRPWLYLGGAHHACDRALLDR